MLVATIMQVSSAKDKNPVIGDTSFYGMIEDICWLTLAELDILQVPSLLSHTGNKSFMSQILLMQDDLTVKAHGLPLNFLRTKSVPDTTSLETTVMKR
ncbi:transposase [Cucumis melo var. makuwa]|uniref:Transposase n=1 Tax=Cucumis melo var. makuwa TaxID=1194695 RepID=A0A5A7U1V3_CUCMM|nr:transposase [Cucumis melo var. makuwa]TYK08272.1 transposase [Cucumis melo var. makuwa]